MSQGRALLVAGSLTALVIAVVLASSGWVSGAPAADTGAPAAVSAAATETSGAEPLLDEATAAIEVGPEWADGEYVLYDDDDDDDDDDDHDRREVRRDRDGRRGEARFERERGHDDDDD